MNFFAGLRRVILWVFLASIAAFTFTALLSIWDVLEKDVVGKSVYSIIVISVSAALIALAAFVAEHNRDIFERDTGRSLSSVGIVISAVIALPLLWFVVGILVRMIW